MFTVYVLYSVEFQEYYIGLTKDLRRRLNEHNRGNTKSTKAFRPWEVIHREEFKLLSEARRREKYLKSAAGRRWRKQNIRPRSSTG